MIYEEHPPAPSLRSIVASYWRFSLPVSDIPASLLHTVPPDGTVSLCWLPPGFAVVTGPQTRAMRVPVQTGMEYLGIRFLPGAAGRLLGIDVTSIRNGMRLVDRPEFATAMKTAGLAGMDALLLGWAEAAGWTGPDEVVAELTRRIVETDGTAPVSALTAGLNLSYRQVLRRFYTAAGLTPKEFARLRRMRAACLKAIASPEPQWAGVSVDAGFADQSHLVREFQDIFGWPPRLVHEYLRRIDHRLGPA